MNGSYTYFPESDNRCKWIAIVFVIGLHITLIWGLWNAQIRQAIEQTAPLFVSLIAQAPPQVEQPPAPPQPEPVKPEPIREPPPPEPPQIVSESPVLDAADFTAPPPPDPVPVEVEAAPEVATAPDIEQVTLPELAVACPDRSPPAYPVWSKRMREQGEVVLQVYLDISGKVVRTEINRTSGSTRLDEAALRAVQRWRCRPATIDGRRVPAGALQAINVVIN